LYIESRVTLELVVDTTILIAVLTGEPMRDQLIARTQGAELVAPASVHWEMGNTFAALLKRRRLKLPEVQAALSAYAQIPIRFVEVELGAAVELADRFGLYAYDAYLIACARRQRAPLMTLDARFGRAARESGVELLEVG
jgi:predicted nucleic acid-binding protein